jgi:hypothetical protein
MDLFCHAEGTLDKLETGGHKTSFSEMKILPNVVTVLK